LSQVGCQARRRGCDGPGARVSSIFCGAAPGAPPPPLKELAAACPGCELGFAEPVPPRARGRMCSGKRRAAACRVFPLLVLRRSAVALGRPAARALEEVRAERERELGG